VLASGLGEPLAAGDRVEVLVYLGDSSTLVGTIGFIVAAPPGTTPPPLAGFTLDIIAPDADEAVTAGGTMYLAATVTHPAGRKSIERVVVDLSDLGGPTELALHDDATMGDATAADGIYSGHVAIPPQAVAGPGVVRVIAYDLDANANDPTGSDASITIEVLPSAIDTIRDIINNFGAGDGDDGIDGLDGFTPAADGGADGDDGGEGDDGAIGLPGVQGPPGEEGIVGEPGVGGADGAGFLGFTNRPHLDAMSPTAGAADTIVRLTGTELVNVSGVTLAVQGASTAYGAAFAPDPSSAPGEGLLFVVPAIAERSYVVNVTTLGGAFATAPNLFRVLVPQPEIDELTPSAAREYVQVNVTGANFTAVTSVTLHSDDGDVGVPWTVVDDAKLTFVTHPGLAPGFYDVNVSNGLKWAIAELSFESLTPLAPADLAVTPTTARVEDILTITGTDLDTVSRVVLSQTNATRLIEADWFLDGTDLKMFVPTRAAPEGFFDLQYTIQLSGTFDGTSTIPGTLTINPTPAPDIAGFSPQRGEPFTQIAITGENFVNVRSVKLGETTVYFAEVDSSEILAVTHGGLAPGNYTITVTTPTGSDVASGTFEALPLTIMPVYNETIFSDVAATLTAGLGTNNDPVTAKIKMRLADASWTITGVTFNPVNYEPQSGSAPFVTMSKVCGPTSRVELWSLASTALHNFISPANELDFVFGVTVKMGGTTTTTYVMTNAENRNFILPAGQGTVTVLDHGWPTNSNFANCS
jgi:hypothetical protein